MIAQGQIALITSTSRHFKYIIRHKGIVFIENGTFYVVHRLVKGIEIVPLEKFLETRTILNIKRYKLKHDVNITELVRTKQYNRYKLINNNCENFCNDFINEHSTKKRAIYSEQIAFWISTGVLALFGGIGAAFMDVDWLTILCAVVLFLPISIFIKSHFDFIK